MLRNYLLVALRNLWRNRAFSLINISGLSVGLAAGILLLLWVQDELSFDRFHRNVGKIYRVSASLNTEGEEQIWNSAPAPITVFGLREVPEIVNACRIQINWSPALYRYGDKSLMQGKTAYVDNTFFELFSFPLIKGNPQKPFSGVRSMVLTETTAQKYFGIEDPIGKIIRVDDKHNYEVSGVIRDMPGNSSLQYEVLLPMDIVKEEFGGNGEWKTIDEDWGNYSFDTYFLLHNATAAGSVAQKITGIHRKNQPIEFTAKLNYLLHPLEKMHLYRADGTDGGIQMVRILGMVAIIIILIACINYVNLATARATKRAKEVSMRKIVGADRKQLFGQFMGESALVLGMSLILALILIGLLVPVYNDLSGKQLVFNPFSPPILTVLALTMLITLVLAGCYPAVLLSSFKPLQLMKSTSYSSGGSNAAFRKGLVVVQFVLSIMLIVSTLVVGSQLAYIRSKNLGYDKENILKFGMREMYKHYDAAKAELLRQPGVMGVTATGGNILNNWSSTGDTDWDGKAPNRTFLINQLSVERDFLEVMNLQLIAGKGFTGTPADSTNFILNETAIRQMGITDPIGKKFKFHDIEGTITGVVKDFHFKNLSQKIEPIILFYWPGWREFIYVKTTARDASKTIAAASKIWNQYNPGYPFEYNFMDDEFNRMYQTDQTVGKLFTFFAAIAIIISCLGLFGLAAYTAEQRTKEIGIRKVLGASVQNIVLLLSREFVRLVVIAFVIATPLAWYIMSLWLENFAYSVGISPWVFAVAGLLALVIAFVTVSWQAIKAAFMNPVKSLRSE
jgi:putative ABC transport system permease protein